jgi:hypothetical protein
MQSGKGPEASPHPDLNGVCGFLLQSKLNSDQPNNSRAFA